MAKRRQARRKSQGQKVAKVLGMTWWQGVSSITGVLALVVTILIATPSGGSAPKPTATGLPVKVDSVSLQPLGEVPSMVFPDALQLNKAKLQSLSQLVTDNIQGSNYFYSWAQSHGGIDPDKTVIQLIVSGNRDQEVRIIGMRAVGASCGPPLTGTLMEYVGAGGGIPDISLGFNFDKSDPNARSYAGGGPWGGDYFLQNTVPLNPGEQKVFEIAGVTKLHDCNFRIQLTILDGTNKISETIGNGNKPFSVSAMLSPEQYKVFYGGGIGMNCNSGWARINAFNPAPCK